MQLPEYYCAGSVKEKSDYVHFSLALPLYTHFTSPLNRYADIVVCKVYRVFDTYWRTGSMNNWEK